MQAKPFDLSKGPLLRATLVTFTDESHRFMLDGASCDQRRLEFAHASSRNCAPPMPLSCSAKRRRCPRCPSSTPTTRNGNANWSRAERASGNSAYWREALRDAPEPLALAVRPRHARRARLSRRRVSSLRLSAADIRSRARNRATHACIAIRRAARRVRRMALPADRRDRYRRRGAGRASAAARRPRRWSACSSTRSRCARASMPRQSFSRLLDSVRAPRSMRSRIRTCRSIRCSMP